MKKSKLYLKPNFAGDFIVTKLVNTTAVSIGDVLTKAKAELARGGDHGRK